MRWSTIAPAIIESCPTRIFLPNDRAIEPQIRTIYESFGLNPRQIELIARATPKQDYYAQTARGNRMFELALGPLALAICGASTPQDQRLMDVLLHDQGPEHFPQAFLAAKGFAAEAAMIGRAWARERIIETYGADSDASMDDHGFFEDPSPTEGD